MVTPSLMRFFNSPKMVVSDVACSTDCLFLRLPIQPLSLHYIFVLIVYCDSNIFIVILPSKLKQKYLQRKQQIICEI